MITRRRDSKPTSPNSDSIELLILKSKIDELSPEFQMLHDGDTMMKWSIDTVCKQEIETENKEEPLDFPTINVLCHEDEKMTIKTEINDGLWDPVTNQGVESTENLYCDISDILRVKNGVFASKIIPEGVIFGPYEGLEPVSRRNGLAWKIKDGKFVETYSGGDSNWMRDVNCAKRESERNLAVFQHLGTIYFKSMKEIKIDQELLVYFGGSSEYFEIDGVEYFIPEIEKELEKLKCSNCSFVFFDEKSLLSHNKCCSLESKGTVIVESSNSIGVENDESFNVKDYIFYEFDENSLKCPTCDKQFTKNLYLRRHVKIHNKNREKLKCMYCPNSYYRKTGLVSHVNKKHANEIKYNCDHCSYETSMEVTLRSHILAMHSNGKDTLDGGEKTFSCTICEKSFNKKDKLLRHTILHNKDRWKDYKCPYCENCYPHKSSLTAHIRDKHLNRKYKCPNCTYVTPRKDTLRRHLFSMHNDEEIVSNENGPMLILSADNNGESNEIKKKFKCTRCERSYTRKHDLIKHLQRHNKVREKECKCPYCSNAYYTKGRLQSHINESHLKNRKYSCHLCEYVGARRNNLQRHIFKKHGNRDGAVDVDDVFVISD